MRQGISGICPCKWKWSWDSGNRHGTIQGIFYRLKKDRLPVSYTHLDVYKRQGYRNGQVVYLKCSGILEKEVPANAGYVVALSMPAEYCPNVDITAYPNISYAGKNIKVDITTTGKVIFTTPEKLPIEMCIRDSTGALDWIRSTILQKVESSTRQHLLLLVKLVKRQSCHLKIIPAGSHSLQIRSTRCV